MNLGKIRNKQESNKFDNMIDNINHKIGRMLGKKNKRIPPQKIKSSTFTIIIVIFSLALWGLTGFYFILENQYGVILFKGRVSHVVSGLKFGITWPYPLGEVKRFNNKVTHMSNIGLDGEENSSYFAMTQNLVPVEIVAQFNYQVDNPTDFFVNTLQIQTNIEDMVRLNLQAKLHEELSKNSFEDLAKVNLTIFSNNLRNTTNQELLNSGLKINKLNINKLKQQNMENKIISSESKVQANYIYNDNLIIDNDSANIIGFNQENSLAKELLKQANEYKNDRISEVKINVDKYKLLYAAYQKAPMAIVEQMYYDLLSSVPINKKNLYPLLNLNLSELLYINKQELDGSLQALPDED